MTIAERLNAYLKADRCWKRPHRIAHAKHMLGLAKEADKHRTPETFNEVVFWTNVLVANQWRPFRVEHKST